MTVRLRTPRAWLVAAGSLSPLLAAFLFIGALAAQAPQSPQLPSEMPAQFKPVTGSFDYVRREVMIPMRDGVKLHTVILVPGEIARERSGASGPPRATDL